MATVPSPKSWTAGDIATASEFNTHIRDAINFFLTPSTCRLRNNADVDLTTKTWTLLSWAVEDVKSESGMHSTSSNTSRLIAVTAGRYMVYAAARGEYHLLGGSGGMQLQIRKNSAGSSTGGSRVLETSRHGTDHARLNPTSNVTGQVSLAANDYLEVFARHSYSSNQKVLSTKDKITTFGMSWIAVI